MRKFLLTIGMLGVFSFSSFPQPTQNNSVVRLDIDSIKEIIGRNFLFASVLLFFAIGVLVVMTFPLGHTDEKLRKKNAEGARPGQ